ncbi:IclR family transcriptional regulator [Actinomadura physcomitrii]|nr:IclR family transcriptional regulator [Actinomadura physcomitrii]
MSQVYVAPAVDLASRVLKLLSGHRTSAATLSMISAELDAPKTSCLRVLRTLQAHDLVCYDPESRRYSLGSYAVVLGARAAENSAFLRALRPVIREAAIRTGWSSAVVQRSSDDLMMMYVAKCESPRLPRVPISIGSRFPIATTSYGKWLLAYSTESERERLLADRVPSMTVGTVLDPVIHQAQLERIREEGVLVSREEYVRGVTAVSCPILDVDQTLIGVLAVLAPIRRSDRDRIEPLVSVMRDISRARRLNCMTIGSNGHHARQISPRVPGRLAAVAAPDVTEVYDRGIC